MNNNVVKQKQRRLTLSLAFDRADASQKYICRIAFVITSEQGVAENDLLNVGAFTPLALALTVLCADTFHLNINGKTLHGRS